MRQGSDSPARSGKPLVKRGRPLATGKSVRLTLDRAVHRYLLDLEVADRSPKTMKWYRQKLDQLQRALGVEGLDEVTRERCLDFISDLRRAGRSPAYVRGWYQVLRGFLGWCREQGYEIDPSLVNERAERWFALKKPIEVDQPIETYTPEDMERILEAAGSPRNELLVTLLVGTGLRLTEALEATVDDWQDDRLRVRQGKGRKPRYVPVNSRLQRQLARWIERQRPDAATDHIFVTQDGRPLTFYAVASIFRRITKQTRLRVHAHAFRHTFATEYLRRGGEIDRLRRILGHTTFRMTSRYVHLAGADLGRGVDELTGFRF